MSVLVGRRPVLPVSALVVGAGGITAGALAGGLAAVTPAVRFLVFSVVIVVMLTAGVAAPRYLLYLLILWVGILGLVRRLVPSASSLDILLLVEPTAVVALVLAAAKNGAFRVWTPLSKAVGVLSALVVLGALNPLQGGLATGASGLLFMLVPIGGFWVGRGVSDDRTMDTAFKLVGLVALAAALYGLFQTFRGFPGWDAAWIARVGSAYVALGVQGTIRAFGTFSASAEYAYYLGIGFVVWVGLWLRRYSAPLTLAVLVILGVAAFYDSTRSVIVMLLFALAVGLAARSRMSAYLAGIIGIAALALVYAVASRYATNSVAANGTTSALVAHQLQGLSDPFNAKTSTLSFHWSELVQGLASAIHYPLGRGVGVVSIAGAKFGGVSAGTEMDPSNVGVALGIPGVLAYVAVVVLGLSATYRLAANEVANRMALVGLFVLTLTLFQWLNGGQYAVAILPWLVLGWVDRHSHSAEECQPKVERDLVERVTTRA
jgi:hypothetical protein